MANVKGSSLEDLPPYQLQSLLDVVAPEFSKFALSTF